MNKATIKRHVAGAEKWIDRQTVESVCVGCNKTIQSFEDYDDDCGWRWSRWYSIEDNKNVCSN